MDTRNEPLVPEDLSRLAVLEHDRDSADISVALESIRNDKVVLLRNVPAEESDAVIHRIANGLP